MTEVMAPMPAPPPLTLGGRPMQSPEPEEGQRPLVVDVSRSEEMESEEEPSPKPPAEEMYLLNYSSHKDQLIEQFKQLYNDGQLTDVTLASVDEDGRTVSFKAHKIILSACSQSLKKLIVENPCKHPTIFLKDVPANHIKALLAYMYGGQIQIKQEELNPILSSAKALNVRGLDCDETREGTQPTQPKREAYLDGPRPLIVDEGRYPLDNHAADKFQHIETESTKSTDSGHSGTGASRRKQGLKVKQAAKITERKASVGQPWGPLPITPSPEETRRASPSAEEARRNSNSMSPNDDNIAVSEDEEAPVDFSATAHTAPSSNSSILFNQLTGPTQEQAHHAQLMAAMMSTMGQGSPAAMEAYMALMRQQMPGQQQMVGQPIRRDSRGDRDSKDSKESGEEEEITEVHQNSQKSLSQTMGLQNEEFAAKLRNQFMSGMPTLTGGAPGFGAAGGLLAAQSWAASLASPNAMASAMQSMGGSRSPPSAGGRPSGEGGSGRPRDRNPVGGINLRYARYKTGEIGANGKPAVACEVCGKKLADPSSLYRHRKIHSGDKPHKCPYCTRRFIQRYNMKQHIKTHRLEAMAEENGLGGNSALHQMAEGLHMSPGLHLRSQEEMMHSEMEEDEEDEKPHTQHLPLALTTPIQTSSLSPAQAAN